MNKNKSRKSTNSNNSNNSINSKTSKDDFDYKIPLRKESGEVYEEIEVEALPVIKQFSEFLFPIMLFFIGVYLQQTINLIFIGHYYDKENKKEALDAIGISHVYVNCSILSLVIGVISGFDTFGSNAYGAKKYHLLGIYYHRAQLIGLSVAVCSLIFQWIFAIRILNLLGLDDKVMYYVDEYIRVFMLFVFFDGQAALNFRYLNIIGKSTVNMMIIGTSLILHPLWCYIFIVIFDYGVVGAAISLLISQFINAAGGFLYVYLYNPLPESIFFYNKDSFAGWKEYLNIAIPSACLMCFEWWSYEVMAVIAIWTGRVNYTVHVIVANLNSNLFMMSLGFSITTTVSIGSLITKHSTEYVKSFVKIIFAYGIVFVSFVCLIIYINRRSVLFIYIDDEAVIENGIGVVTIMCILNVFDMIQFICNGLIRAFGKQLVASYITFFNSYVTQTFFSIFFGKFFGWGVFGVWIGFLIGTISNVFAYMYLLSTFDLSLIKEEILNRVDSDNNKLTELDYKKASLITGDYEISEKM